VTITQDCNNPLLDLAMKGVLNIPVIASQDMSFCPRLQGKEICCNETAISGLVNQLKQLHDDFENVRKRQNSVMAERITESQDNLDTDA